jgi:hypothetical protein
MIMCLSAHADTVTLTLDPVGGDVSGSPGNTVGWGYTLDNGTSDYLIVSDSNFCEAGQDPLLTTCSPTLGASTYTDFTSSNFILIAPGGTASASFDPGTLSGVGEYSLDPAITSGSDVGSITVVYDLFDADPTQGAANQICADPDLGVCDFEVSAAAEVDVLGGTSPVPEPANTGLLTGGFLVAIAAYLRSQRRRRA